MYNRTDSGWLESTYLAVATSTSILKLIFLTAYCFCFDSHLNGCVVAIFVVVFSVVIPTVILIFVVVVVITTFTFVVGITVGFFSLLLLLIFIYGLFV